MFLPREGACPDLFAVLFDSPLDLDVQIGIFFDEFRFELPEKAEHIICNHNLPVAGS